MTPFYVLLHALRGKLYPTHLGYSERWSYHFFLHIIGDY